jgi:hypothetical protein
MNSTVYNGPVLVKDPCSVRSVRLEPDRASPCRGSAARVSSGRPSITCTASVNTPLETLVTVP